MAGKPKPARVKKWNGDYFLFYFDYATGKQVRRKCSTLGAINHVQRKELEKQYRAKETMQHLEVAQSGGRVDGNSKLVDDIKLYLDDCAERAEVRQQNPKAGLGISATTSEIIARNVGHFCRWLDVKGYSRMRTKDLGPNILKQYIRFVVTEGTNLGAKKALRSANTVNQYIRNLKTCIRWISHLKPRRIVDRDELMDALKAQRGKRKAVAVAYSPDELLSFLSTAIDHEMADYTATVVRSKGGKTEQFQQTAPSTSATPVSRLFLLIALTGCRRGEALSLRWDDVDLERGRIVIHAEKTGMERWIPLKSAAEGSVAPRFCALLRIWWAEDPDREFVLPHTGLEQPNYPKKAWESVLRELDFTESTKIGPQKLRQNFTSYAASLGIPPAVAAMWQGHSADVAQKHYRAQVLERNPNATSFEDAMGLTSIIERLIVDSEQTAVE